MVWLHYVGGRYTPSSFVDEARKEGVSRRIPLTHLKNVSWGDIVFCAKWEGGRTLVSTPQGDKFASNRARGYAHVFCAFAVERVTFEDALVWKQIKARIADRIVETTQLNRVVRRRCGLYVETEVVKVDISIGEIYGIARSIDPKAHVMIQGPLVGVLEPPKVLVAPFARGLIKLSEKEGGRTQGDLALVLDHIITRTKKEWEEVMEKYED